MELVVSDEADEPNGSWARAPATSGRLYEVPLEVIALLSFCYGTISLVAVVGNAFVLWIVATSRRMRTETNYLIANLAISDIIIGLFSIPFHFQAALLQRWLLPRFMCAFCPFVQVVSVNVSIFTLTAIAVDRYRAITIPLKARLNSRLTARALISVIWAVSMLTAVPYALALRVTLVQDAATGQRTRPFCHNVVVPPAAWRLYNNALVCLQYFVPLLVICYVYEKIRRLLKDSTIPGNPETVRDAIVVRNKKKVRTSSGPAVRNDGSLSFDRTKLNRGVIRCFKIRLRRVGRRTRQPRGSIENAQGTRVFLAVFGG